MNPQAASLIADSKTHLRQECESELRSIADWWMKCALDNERGGFYGEIENDNTPIKKADKGVVLNTRILWFFSRAASFTGRGEYRSVADRAYEYLLEHFLDKEHGGFYWALDCYGKVIVSKKQVYAQAFVIYGLSAYFSLTGNQQAIDYARECFRLIENNCKDRHYEGYFEAYTRQWGRIEDVRLSEKDLNVPKTMNTHLHVLEAYTELYKVCPDKKIADALSYGIHIFDRYIIDHKSGHLRTFMSSEWHDKSPGLTYGHDIESSWLLWKALKALNDQSLINRVKPTIVHIAKTCQEEAFGEYGAIIDAYSYKSKKYNINRVWWVQAEALVGFLTAYKITEDVNFWKSASSVWAFIKNYQIDHLGGEWLWYSSLDAPDDSRDYKAGFWKGPYHNGRAMIEASQLLEKL